VIDDRQLNELAAQFFRVFARAEYALKASGYNDGDGPAAPNWRQFAFGRRSRSLTALLRRSNPSSAATSNGDRLNPRPTLPLTSLLSMFAG
jgi:hypothetical protein